jgi:nucleotide-binding universal stress UspA family protein
MTYKTILVQCDAARNVAPRLDVAAELAQRQGAHLVALHARQPFQAPAFVDGGFPMDDLFRSYEATVKADLATATAAFEKATKGRQLSAELRVVDGFVQNELATNGRYADLLVLGQTDPENTLPTPADLPEVVALASGRPVLVVPYIGIKNSPGKTVMLCWNASRESAHAATAALPFLKVAAKVIVLTIDAKSSPAGHGAEPGADAATWLTRHGVKVTVQRDVASESDVGGTILSRAADHAADLIVMGLYGHSRLREMVLGGTSRTLLASMTVPVFVAH